VGGERAVAVAFFDRKHGIGLDPPQQLGAGGTGFDPQGVAEDSAVGQQHARQQRAQHLLSQGRLALPIGADRGIDDRVRSALGQPQPNSPSVTPSGGRSKPPSTNSRPTSAARDLVLRSKMPDGVIQDVYG
jgi:hypothetical protein